MKIRNIFAAIAALGALPTSLMISGATAGEALLATADITRRAAYISAGAEFPTEAYIYDRTSREPLTQEPVTETAEAAYEPLQQLLQAETSETDVAETSETDVEEKTETGVAETAELQIKTGRVISQNITYFDEQLDYSAEGNNNGTIVRRCYTASDAAGYITLESGAQVRNCTDIADDELLAAAEELPQFSIELNSDEPQVLIIHTHTTESYEPYTRSYYDESFPTRTRDSAHNMVAVGEMLAQTLAENGVSVLHDGTVHDYPSYTNSYDRSEETIRAILEEYPSIKVVIDLHRDAMAEPDGTRIAPVAEIDGKNAAQFMIISGCDDGTFNMPDYMENFKLAALIQNSSETKYPELSRAVLFDYRNYNQHITTGSLLIEVGSHANSLEEALYCAELLGESMAEALAVLAQE